MVAETRLTRLTDRFVIRSPEELLPMHNSHNFINPIGRDLSMLSDSFSQRRVKSEHQQPNYFTQRANTEKDQITTELNSILMLVTKIH